MIILKESQPRRVINMAVNKVVDTMLRALVLLLNNLIYKVFEKYDQILLEKQGSQLEMRY